MDLERRMTIANTMNKMGPGIIGSSRSEAYVRAMYAASAERYCYLETDVVTKFLCAVEIEVCFACSKVSALPIIPKQNSTVVRQVSFTLLMKVAATVIQFSRQLSH
uniref:Uncharacterized protein n=1 Tax=Coccidioides posadasii RMSCC 3488 TaxID=454284 RepID=A0A0J6FDM2_COCPO|nr:hypothetical protein CPAG_04735 [Coccidioides posadasii RMSCC 3488]